jgi:hypothetical protein
VPRATPSPAAPLLEVLKASRRAAERGEGRGSSKILGGAAPERVRDRHLWYFYPSTSIGLPHACARDSCPGLLPDLITCVGGRQETREASRTSSMPLLRWLQRQGQCAEEVGQAVARAQGDVKQCLGHVMERHRGCEESSDETDVVPCWPAAAWEAVRAGQNRHVGVGALCLCPWSRGRGIGSPHLCPAETLLLR